MNRAGKPEDTELSAKVLEYYRLHSQNNELTKYFCGTSTNHYIQTIPTPTSGSINISPQPQTAFVVESNIPTINIDDAASECEPTRNPSPTSSIASHRRLEWDNGADIGYENCSNKSLQKSVSLPVLSAIRIHKDMSSDKTSSSDSSTNSSDKNKTDGVIVKSSITLTDNISSPHQDIVMANETIMKFLRSKVGFPGAESTPYNKLDVVGRKSDPVETPTTSKRDQRKKSTSSNNVKNAISSSPESKIIDHADNISSDDLTNSSHGVGEGKRETKDTSSDSDKNEITNKSTPSKTDSDKTSSTGDIPLRNNLETSFFMYEIKENPQINSSSNSSSIAQTKIISSSDTVEESSKVNSSSGVKIQNGSFSDDTVRRWSSDLDFTLPQRMKYFNRYRNRKIKNLATSVPFYVECIDTDNIQSNTSIGIQTEPTQRQSNKKRTKQEVGHIHSDDKAESSSNSTTESEMKVSNCNSFEFLYGSAYNSLKTAEQSTSNIKVDEVLSEYLTKNLKRTSVRRNLSNITPPSEKSTASSQENYLSHLLAQHQLNAAEVDVQKSLTLIHKLQKSKKYNEETKKHYTKKILKQLLKSIKTNDDSSMSSDRITPNIENKIPSRDQNNYTSSEIIHEKLHSNVPWTPVRNLEEHDMSSNKLSKSNHQFSIPTTSQYIDNYNTNSSNGNSSSKYYQRNYIQKHYATSDTDISQPKSFASSDGNKSWKENKTISERILEQKFDGSGDSTPTPPDKLDIAKNERQNQLDWIKNEIEHLQKLKDLLENKKKSISKSPVSDNVDKSTSVYMITTERSTDDGGKTTSKVDYVKGITDPVELREINLRLHEHLGSKDYKIKEIITKVFPKESSASKISTENKSQATTSDSTSVQLVDSEPTKLTESSNVQISDYRIPKNDKNTKDTSENKDVSKNVAQSDFNKIVTVYDNPIFMSSTGAEEEAKKLKGTCSCYPKWSDCSSNYKSVRDNVHTVTKESTVHLTSHQPRHGYEPQSMTGGTQVKISTTAPKHGGINCRLNFCNCKDKKKPCNASNGIIISSSSNERLDFDKAKVIECKQGETANVKTLLLEIPYCDENEYRNNTMYKQNSSRPPSTSYTHPTSPPETPISSQTTVSSAYTASVLCSCCKRRGSRSSAAINSGRAFCEPCYNESKKRTWNDENPYFTQPQHSCNCYSKLEEIRDTMEELKLLEKCENYCKCLEPNKRKNRCANCSCKVKKNKHQKPPVAYVLTFEPGNEEGEPSLRKANSLEEICMKIPHTHHSGKSRRKHSGHKYKDKTVQDYLVKNRPEFIKSADQRRECMIDLAYMREQRCQKYKQLLALTNGIPMQNPGYSQMHKKRLFSVKEMKNMTAKKYKNLPEVQNKLLENKDRQIKKANRLLADIFNKKLRENVLRGCPTIAANISVINLA